MTSVGKGLLRTHWSCQELILSPSSQISRHFFSPRGSAVLLHPSNFPQRSSALLSPTGWDSLEWSEWKWTFFQPLYLTSQQLLLLYSPFPAQFVAPGPEVWGNGVTQVSRGHDAVTGPGEIHALLLTALVLLVQAFPWSLHKTCSELLK